MRAWSLQSVPGEYSLAEVPTPSITSDEVLIRVVTSALNHMDIWLTKGLPAPQSFPHVPGSDVAGIIEAIGANVCNFHVGDEVVVNPALVPFEALSSGLDSVLDPSMSILGEHSWGGHGEFCAVAAHQLELKPQNRSWVETVTQPICGTNAWRLLRKAGIQAGDTVLVTGIGGGVATSAMSIAMHLGAEVHVTSRDPQKRAWALELGAAGAHDSAEDRYNLEADIVIDSIGPATWDAAIRSLRRGGKMCVCGGTSGRTVELNLPRLFFSQIDILSATCGSQEEFRFVNGLLAAGLPVAVDSVHKFSSYPAALDRLRSGEQRGKVILDHSR